MGDERARSRTAASLDEEREILKRTTGSEVDEPEHALSAHELQDLQKAVREVPVADSVLQYGLSLVVGTHPEGEGSTPVAQKYCRYGASPRGAQALVTAGKIYALLDGRYNVSKEDLKKAAKPALRHRIILNFEAEADGVTPDQVVNDVVSHVESTDRDPIGV